MPMCHIFTNVTAASLKEGIETRLAKVIAETLEKPLERMIVVIVPDVYLFRKGSTEPACTVNISCISRFSKEANPSYTGPLKEAFSKEFGVPKERVALVYHDQDADMIGI